MLKSFRHTRTTRGGFGVCLSSFHELKVLFTNPDTRKNTISRNLFREGIEILCFCKKVETRRHHEYKKYQNTPNTVARETSRSVTMQPDSPGQIEHSAGNTPQTTIHPDFPGKKSIPQGAFRRIHTALEMKTFAGAVDLDLAVRRGRPRRGGCLPPLGDFTGKLAAGGHDCSRRRVCRLPTASRCHGPCHSLRAHLTLAR